MPRKAFVSGTFDLLHSGHVAFLTEAASHGELYVSVGNDECVFRLKGRYPVNSQDERKYLIDSLRCVKECRISRGTGLLDFVGRELRDIRPDVFVVNEDGAHESKAQLCRDLGIEYLVLRRLPHGGLPARSTTALRDECTIPFRIDLAGGWLDQPFVSCHHPGAVLTISLEPTHAFNNRSGMATSTRNKAIELWRTALPQGNKEQVAKLLFSYENPPGTKEVAGSQDAIGIVYPGPQPARVQRGLLALRHRVGRGRGSAGLARAAPAPGASRAEGGRIQRAGRDARDRRRRPRTWPPRPTTAGRPSWPWTSAAFGRAFTASFDAQVAMFPNMASQAIYDQIDAYRDLAHGWKLSGAGGGGYLILVADGFVPDAIQVRIRRQYAVF